MIFKIGTYSADTNEVSVSLSKDQVMAPRGYRIGTLERWDLTGVKIGSSISDLTTKLAALETAFDSHNQTVTILEDDASTETAHKIDTGNTIGGVKIVNFGYPEGDGAEYSTFRTWTATIEALRDDAEAGMNGLIEFRESIRRIGNGGPKDIFLETLTGVPVAQRVSQVTVVRLVQSGRAVGHKVRPNVPGPLFPANLINTEEQSGKDSPRSDRGRFLDFVNTWSYTFHGVGLGIPEPNAA